MFVYFHLSLSLSLSLFYNWYIENHIILAQYPEINIHKNGKLSYTSWKLAYLMLTPLNPPPPPPFMQ